MKNLLLVCLIFFFGRLSTFSQVITFDDQGYTNNQALGNPYSIINNGETFLFTVSNGGAPNATDNIYRTDENSCGASGLGHLYSGNFSATTWTIETSSGNEINLGRIRFDNVFPCFAFSYSLTIEGFKNSVSTGAQVFTVSGLNDVFISNSNFDDVDRIVITAVDLANLGIDDIEFDVILPVELLNFVGKINDGIELSWQTMSEVNNDRFEVEESKDGIQFEKIGEVKGRGTTSVQQAYSFVIDKPETGLKYYRLKQIDFDGQFEYSKVINVNFNGEVEECGEFYPNPSKFGLINLGYVSPNDKEIIISFFDMGGNLVANQISQVFKGDNRLSFDFLNLTTGVYLIKIRDERKSIHRKLIIEK